MEKIILILLLFSGSIFAKGIEETIRTDFVTVGHASSTDPVEMFFNVGDGVSNPKISVNKTIKNFVLSKDANIQGDVTLGDGSNVTRKVIVNKGAGANNPALVWNHLTSAWETFDGVVQKKIGSGSGGGTGGINLLKNPSFEDPGTPILNWDRSGGTLTQESLTNSRDNNEKFARFVASGAAEYFESDLIIISDDINDGGCMADFHYDQGDNVFKAQVLYASGSIVAESDLFDNSGFLKAPTITFPCNPGEQFRLRFLASGAGTIDADEAYLGSNKGFISGDNINTCSAIFDASTPASVFKVSEQGDCNFGVSRTALGDYTFTYTGLSVKPVVDCQAAKGSDQALIANIDSDKTYDNTTASCRFSNAADTAIDPDGDFIVFELIKQGVDAIKSVKAFVPEQSDFLYFGEFSKSSGSCATGTDSIVNCGNSGEGALLTNKFGSALKTCSGGNASTSLETCPSGNSQNGIEIYLPVAGKYKVCNASSLSSGSAINRFAIVKTNNQSDTIIEEGSQQAIIGATDSHPTRFCEIFEVQTPGVNTFKLYGEGAAAYNWNLESGAIGAAVKSIFSVELISNFSARPIIQNMVSTQYINGKITESCRVNNNGTATIETASNLCGWIDSVSRTAAGFVNVVPKVGTFPKIPVCLITAMAPGSGNVGCVVYESPSPLSTSLIPVLCEQDTTGAAIDTDFSVMCEGAK